MQGNDAGFKIRPDEPLGRAILVGVAAQKERDAAPAAPAQITLTAADKRAGLGAQRAAEALAANVPLHVEREASALESRLAGLADDTSIETISGTDHAALKRNRERIINGEVKIV